MRPGIVKPVLSSHSKKDKTKVLKADCSLVQVKSIAKCSLGVFCNTFDLHKVIIGLENQFLVFFFEWPLKTRFTILIAPLSDIPMFYIKYLTNSQCTKFKCMLVQLRKLLYGCTYVREIIHSLKLVDYLTVHTHKPYNNIYLSHLLVIFLCFTSNISQCTKCTCMLVQ